MSRLLFSSSAPTRHGEACGPRTMRRSSDRQCPQSPMPATVVHDVRFTSYWRVGSLAVEFNGAGSCAGIGRQPSGDSVSRRFLNPGMPGLRIGNELLYVDRGAWRSSAASLIAQGLQQAVDVVKSVHDVGGHPDPVGPFDPFHRHGDPKSLVEVEALESIYVERRD